MRLLDVYAAVLLPLTALTAVAAAAVDLTAKGQAPLPGHKPPPPVLNPYPSQRALHFTHSTFKVLIVTDTHLLDDQTVPGNATNVSRASTQAVESYLAMEKPDYVVHLGDIVSGEAAESAEDVVGAVRQVLGPVVKAKIPFSTAKGNHDNDKYSTHSAITDVERRLSPQLSYTRKAPAGVGGGDVGTDNYWVPIHAGKGDRKPALVLWFFDSRAGHEMLSKGSGPIDDWVDASVAKWIQDETAAMEQAWDAVPPSLLFVHIPLHASLETQTSGPYKDHIGGVSNETSQNFTTDQLPYEGLNVDVPLASQGQGEGYSGQDRAFLDAFLSSAAGKARVHGIVSGHDHGNDWCAPGSVRTAADQLVPLCFAKHSGFGGYDYDEWNHGARVFQFHLPTIDTSVDTYVRFLTGEKRFAVALDDKWATQVPARR